MSSNNWKRLETLNPRLLEILRATKGHLTTNDIKNKLFQKYSIIVSWETTMKYLLQMEAAGHIEKAELQTNKNKIVAWRIKNAGL